MTKRVFQYSLITAALLLTTVLFGCVPKTKVPAVVPATEPAETPVPETPTPVPTETPEAILLSVTPLPTMTPQPTPTPTPTPSPTPTPKPTVRPREVVIRESYKAEDVSDDPRRVNLLLDTPIRDIIAMRDGRIRMYESPDAHQDDYIIVRNPNTWYLVRTLVVLDEVKGSLGNMYHVRAAFTGQEGYVPAWMTWKEEYLTVGSGVGLVTRPGAPLMKQPTLDEELLGRCGFQLVRIFGTKNDFSYVVTEDGRYGFVQTGMIQIMNEEQIEEYLSMTRSRMSIGEPVPEEAYGVPAAEADGESGENIDPGVSPFARSLAAELSHSGSGETADMETFLLYELSRRGLFFEPGYYVFAEDDLTNEKLYPDGLYTDPKYNSLLFKLFNTAGNLVTYDGHATEWRYIDTVEALQPGDIVFFSEVKSGETARLKDTEVVLRGQYSGYVTSCGLYLGEDRVLIADKGVLRVVTAFSESELAASFDCGRRIFLSVQDEKLFIIEELISAEYDRLGTPYDNLVRTGDDSYDCSGMLTYAMRSIGLSREWRTDRLLQGSTASGMALVRKYYLNAEKNVDMTALSNRNGVTSDIKKLQRGDIIFLTHNKGGRVGHVMLYLGNNTVIHSTTINSLYRGTLVAGFRPALQVLYSHAIRITNIQ